MPADPAVSDAPQAGPIESDRNRAPIYVGGLDRCGKTTMSGFLASHPNISIPAVGSNMWTYFYGRYGDLGEARNLDRCLADLLCYKHVRFLDPDVQLIRAEFAEGPPTYARLFSLFLIHHAERAGKPRWGAQTGLIERYADRLFDAYGGGLRIVHMIRDPRDRYLASLEKWPDGKGRAGGATARWNYSTGLAERHVERYPTGYLIVRFEDLIEDTESTLRRVCEFVGEDFVPEMLSMSGFPKHRDRLTEGVNGNALLLSSNHIGRYRGRVPAGEIAFIERHAGRRMRRFGYELSAGNDPLRTRIRHGVVAEPSQLARMMAWRTVEALQQRFPRAVRRRPAPRMILDPPPDPGGPG